MRVAALIALLLALALPSAAGSASRSTGLRGHVTVGGASAKHRQLWFRRVFIVTKTTTNAYGNYQITLGPGSYFVSTVNNVGARPASVTVAAGRVRVVNFTLPR